MRTLASTLLAAVCLLALAVGADARQQRIPWLTFNEVSLDGKRRVLSAHDVFPIASSLSPRRDQFAYVSYTCDGCDRSNRLTVADVRRSRDHLLVQAHAGIHEVAWAPDGETLALNVGGRNRQPGVDGTWLIGADGSNFRRLGEVGAMLAWSPDSRRLAAVRRDDRGRSYIVVFSLATGEARYVTPGFRPRWSPDGARLLFEFVTGRSEELKIRVVNASGRQPRTVARGSDPSWSPDGRRIAFVRYEYSEPSVWLASSRGGTPRRLVDNADTAVWSPDSHRIAVTQSRRYCSSKLTVVRADGGTPRRLATHSRQVDPLAWSTNRKTVYMAQLCTDQ